jgi:hypothetical protein
VKSVLSIDDYGGIQAALLPFHPKGSHPQLEPQHRTSASSRLLVCIQKLKHKASKARIVEAKKAIPKAQTPRISKIDWDLY